MTDEDIAEELDNFETNDDNLDNNNDDSSEIIGHNSFDNFL